MKLHKGQVRAPHSRRHAQEVPRDEPQEDELDIHELLLNWAAWCIWRRTPGRTGSAEGRYVAEKGNVYNPPNPSAKVNIPAAEELNAAMLELPDKQRLALHYRYYLGKPDAGIAKALDLDPAFYLRFMRDARFLLQAILQKRPDRLLSAQNQGGILATTK